MKRLAYILAALATAGGLLWAAGEGEKAAPGTSVGTDAHAGWITDFEAAKTAATERKVPILADFSGSDWCGWCIKLNNEVFTKSEFLEFAKDNLVLFLADFPAKKPQSDELKAQNKKLAEQYRVEGFPTVMILNAKGEVLTRTGYRPGGPEGYVEHLKAEMKKES